MLEEILRKTRSRMGACSDVFNVADIAGLCIKFELEMRGKVHRLARPT